VKTVGRQVLPDEWSNLSGDILKISACVNWAMSWTKSFVAAGTNGYSGPGSDRGGTPFHCNLDRTRPLRSRIGYFLRSERHSLGYVLQVERSTSVTDSPSNQVETEPPEAVTGRWQLIVVAVAFVSHDRIIHRRRFCPNFFLERYHKSFSAMGNAKTIADPKTVDIRRVLHGPF
jgi:hypothetical protein